MSPEQIRQLVNEEIINILGEYQNIPFEVQSALQERLILNQIESSTKTATSENQSVDEASSGTYDVLQPPDGFDERNDNGTIKHYPYYL